MRAHSALLVAVIALLASCTTSMVDERGTIEVLFCPEECAAGLSELSSTKSELACAFYDYEAEALPLPERARLLVFEHNHAGVGEPVSSRALMHNKFCLVGERAVWTGSMNPTRNGIMRNDNNLLIINSSCVARNFAAEWRELREGGERGLPCPAVNLSGTIIETRFCPEDKCLDALIAELSQAQESIRFLTFSFTLDEAAEVLITKHEAGIEVRGVFESRMRSHTIFEDLLEAGIDVVWDANPATMHHKLFIIDNTTIITGSMNPSGNGVARNDETLLIIRDARIAREYLDEFARVRNAVG